MVFENIFNILVHTLLIFFIVYIYQNINNLIFNKKNILSLSFMSSILLKILASYFNENILVFGICLFSVLSITLYLINSNYYFQIMYYTSFITTLVFFVYALVEFVLFGMTSSICSIVFSHYIYALFLGIIILCLLIYVLELKFLLPADKVSIFILFSSVLILFVELMFYEQFTTFSTWTISHIIIYITIGLIGFNYNIIIQYLYNNFYKLTTISQNNFLSKITEGYIHKIMKEQDRLLKVKHDLKNNLIIINQLLCNSNIDEAIHFLKELDHSLDSNTTEIYTGNIILDSFFSYLINKSNKSIKIKSNDLSKLNCQSDLISLVVNIVDNAEKNAETEIKISINYQENNDILIKVSNDCEINPINEINKTRKRGDHGNGLRIVQDIISNYSGTYITSYDNVFFTTYILLKLGGVKNEI